MATTKIWVIKDSIFRVISYAKNPEKTTFSDLKQVLKYAENDEKTIDKKEKTMYITTRNIAYHAYQSFKTGEVSPELAHKIGVELAERMLSEHIIISESYQMNYAENMD